MIDKERKERVLMRIKFLMGHLQGLESAVSEERLEDEVVLHEQPSIIHSVVRGSIATCMREVNNNFYFLLADMNSISDISADETVEEMRERLNLP